jgi:hypothetical protein
LDAIYTTQYLDIYLGTAPAPAYNGNPPNQPNAVVANGGAYIDTYSSHAPEELIPGSEFDTLDLRVYTRSGSDWPEAGHGFPIQNIKYEFTAPLLSSQTFSWDGLQPYPSQIVVYNQTTGLGLNEGVNYTVDYVNQTVTVTSGATTGNILVISVYSLGGGNQLFESLYNESVVGSSVIIPVQFGEIFELAIFVDGENYTDFSFEPSYELPGVQTVYVPTGSSGTTLVVDNTLDISVGSLIVGTGFSSGQTVIGKFNITTLLISAAPNTTPSGVLTFRANDGSTMVEFNTPLAAGAEISLTAIGPTIVNDSSIDYSWSLPQTQLFVADGIATTFTLNNSMDYNNPVNSVITVNGVRARTAGGVEYISDGSTVVYDLPTRLGFSQALISDNEVEVYQNNIPLTLNLDYSVDPFVPGIDRTVTLSFTPDPLDEIQVYVTTNAQAYIVGDQLIFAPGMGLIPILGDIISVTSWNDTRQQNLLTQVYVGPVTEIQPVYQGYDKTDYDIGTVSGLPGSFSYESTGGVVLNNLFLSYPTANPDRLWVTLNGRRLFNGVGFTLNGNEIVLFSGILGSNDVVMITESTDSTVPEAMAFRIFQDMRGLQLTYRITPDTTTVLTQNLGQLDDVIYVEDASRLANPNLTDNIWGVITIDGERIMYRNRNTVTNTVSSLMRGTAGTGAAEHPTGTAVYDMGRDNLLSDNYQNYVVSDSTLADGTQTVFSAPNVTTEFTDDSTLASDTVEVYVGGQRQQDNYTITQVAPVIVEFDVAPPAGVEVTILVRRGVTWYAPGPTTPSNGIALQETNTPAARFLRGLA